jgi:hypothetical protein
VLARTFAGGLTVMSGRLASGPSAALDGFSIEVSRLGFSDYRTTSDDSPDTSLRRELWLQLAVRSTGPDPEQVRSLENVRALDQDGRDVLDLAGDAVNAGSRLTLSAFPDERVQTVAFDWPYPRPHRLKLIEGDLVLHRSVRHTELEVALPAADSPPGPLSLGDGQIQFTRLRRLNDALDATAQIVQPPNVDFQIVPPGPPVVVVLADGSRAPISASTSGYGLNDGMMTGYASLTAARLKSRPVRLVWPMVVKSEATTRQHFRFTDYPALLGPVLPTGAGPGARNEGGGGRRAHTHTPTQPVPTRGAKP